MKNSQASNPESNQSREAGENSGCRDLIAIWVVILLEDPKADLEMARVAGPAVGRGAKKAVTSF